MRVLFFAAMLLVSASAAHAQTWTFVRQSDAMSDEDRSLAITRKGDRFLSVRCMSDGLNVNFGYGTYFGGDSDDQILVQVRFDSDPAQAREWWDLASNNESAFSPLDRVQAFVAAARKASTVTLRATDPLDDEQVTESFSLTDFSAAVSKLSCKS